MSTSSSVRVFHVDEGGAGVEHPERVQVRDARTPQPLDLHPGGGDLVGFVLVEHDAVLAGECVRPPHELVACGAEAVEADEPVLAPVRILVPVELAAELGDAALEVGRGRARRAPGSRASRAGA